MINIIVIFFFNDTATTEIYTLSLHDALPILGGFDEFIGEGGDDIMVGSAGRGKMAGMSGFDWATYKDNPFGVNADLRSEEHTSELQSRQYLVCRLLLEKKKKQHYHGHTKNIC